MKKQIQLDAPNLSALEKRNLTKCIDDGFVSTFGPFVQDFENKFARYVGAKAAVSTQSGTAAIHIALYELGIGKGDEVIVPALTFVATVNPVIYVGARPVFVDVDAKTWNIDHRQIESRITKKTKAIIPVHLYGNPCEMDEIIRMARKYGIAVIEDATESLGALYKDRHTGTIGNLGCFSFNGNKLITTGGGGMVAGNNIKQLSHIKFLVNQARDESYAGGYYHPEIGFNYRMTNIEAALGLAQMEKLNKFLRQKKKFNLIYKDELRSIGSIRFQDEYRGAKPSYWITSILFDNKTDITALQKSLRSKGIQSRRIFIPIVEFGPYRYKKMSLFRNAYSIYENGLCLPSSTLNCEDSIYYVCTAIKDFFKR